MASDFLDTKRRVGFYRRSQGFMFNRHPAASRPVKNSVQISLRGRGKKIFQIVIGN